MAKTIKVLASLACVAFILPRVIDKCTTRHSSAGEAQPTPTGKSVVENEAYFSSKVSEEWAKLSTWLSYQSESTENHEEAAEIDLSNLSDFVFHRTYDSNGYDIKRSSVTGGVKAYADECLSIPNCAGFNSNGYLKYTIRAQNEWNRPFRSQTNPKGLYVRKSNLSKFDLHSNVDSAGKDIRKSTLSGGIEAYANECLAIPRCAGFNARGWLKYEIKNEIHWDSHSDDLYVKKTSLEKFDFHPKVASRGNNIRQSTLSGGVEAYADECLAIPNCVGFTSNGYLKKEIRNEIDWTASFIDLYVKKSSSLDKFDYHPGKDSAGFDIKLSTLSGGVEAYADECLAIPACVGFNSYGWLKRRIRRESNWNTSFPSGKGLYVKKEEGPTCKDSPFKFLWNLESITCNEVKSKRLCATPEVAGQCRATCNICDKCADATRIFTFVNARGVARTRTCKFVARDTSRCTIDGISDTCPLTCKSCD